MSLAAQLQDSTQGLFPGLLGVTFVDAAKDGIRATMKVREDLCTMPGVLHGGAIMAFADTLGAYGTFLNLPEGARTTTLESKTNFFAAGRGNTTITGEATPLHRGRTTMVWQTRVESEDAKLLALVTQTQVVLMPDKSAEEQLAGLFEGQSIEDQQALFARLERAGAGLYRVWAAAESDSERKAALLEAAEREEANAEALEGR
jgi:1,4-dihydroxy-2-naphthoyl-CoA hydrolase